MSSYKYFTITRTITIGSTKIVEVGVAGGCNYIEARDSYRQETEHVIEESYEARSPTPDEYKLLFKDGCHDAPNVRISTEVTLQVT